MSDEKPVTHAQFMKNSTHFQDACAKANTPVTKRQAAKFRMKRGKAYKAHLILKNGAKQDEAQD